jgi:4-diphosphocytidyl-2-C-methyl-D-erythritol kinase
MTVEPPHTLTMEARAKVNLFLRVIGRRSDGYHELETLVAPIELSDRLEIHAHSDPTELRTLALSLDVTGDPELTRSVPADESNLVMRAAASLAGFTGVLGFADITLEKRVPVEAGLGGGSADAAATLRGLNELWACRLDEDGLRQVGQMVGSDVPALLAGGAVVARGRGERVERVLVADLKLALITFPFGVRTAEAFRWWDEDGGRTGPDPQPVLAAAAAGSAESLGALAYNDLEDVVIRRHPVIGEARDLLLKEGAAGVAMCGSGPTLAALLPSDRIFEPPKGLTVAFTRTVGGTGADV